MIVVRRSSPTDRRRTLTESLATRCQVIILLVSGVYMVAINQHTYKRRIEKNSREDW